MLTFCAEVIFRLRHRVYPDVSALLFQHQSLLSRQEKLKSVRKVSSLPDDVHYVYLSLHLLQSYIDGFLLRTFPTTFASALFRDKMVHKILDYVAESAWLYGTLSNATIFGW